MRRDDKWMMVDYFMMCWPRMEGKMSARSCMGSVWAAMRD